MIELIDKIYQPRKMDNFKPITERKFQEDSAKKDIQIAEMMIHLKTLADKVGVELLEGEQLDSLVEQVVLADRKEVQIEKEMQTFFKREQQFQDGALGERMKRLIGRNNVNPFIKYGEDLGGYNPMNQVSKQTSNNDETVLAIVQSMQQQQAETNKQFASILEKLANTNSKIDEDIEDKVQ